MEIKYEIRTLENAGGEGKSRKFVALHTQSPMTEGQMAEYMEANSTLKKGDIKAVFTEFRQLAISQLQQTGHVYLPGIGWLSIQAGLKAKAQQDGHKITSKDITMQAIQLKTEKHFYETVKKGIRFAKSDYSTQSVEYTEDTLWPKIADYIEKNQFITSAIMQKNFGLSRYMVNKWLSLFVEEGKLEKKGIKNNRVYFMHNS